MASEKICDTCGYTYIGQCQLCSHYRELVKRCRALDNLSSACFWADGIDLASYVLERRIALERQLPHCHKCSWPHQHEFPGGYRGERVRFPISLHNGQWECNEFGWDVEDADCSERNNIPAPTAGEIAASLEAKGIPVDPIYTDEMAEKDVLETIMNILIPNTND